MISWDDVLKELKIIRDDFQRISVSDMEPEAVYTHMREFYDHIVRLMNSLAGQEIPLSLQCEIMDLQICIVEEDLRVMKEIRVKQFGPSQGSNIHVEL
jgi:hypothetical protein